MVRHIWRIAEPGTLQNPEQWAAGLRLHIRHSPITSICMQVAEQQRCYVVLEGCAGCVRDQCMPGCRTQLFRRLLESCWGTVRLRLAPVAGGLIAHPYGAVSLLTPGRTAAPLASAVLGTSDGRLYLQWSGAGEQLQSLALLAGPGTPALALEVGWRVSRRLPWMLRRAVAAPLPPILQGGAIWPAPPYLLWPAVPSREAASATHSNTDVPQRQ